MPSRTIPIDFLFNAVTRGDLEDARRWLAEGADPDGEVWYQQPREDGSIYLHADLRPLTAAVSRGDLALARLLLEQGADANAADWFDASFQLLDRRDYLGGDRWQERVAPMDYARTLTNEYTTDPAQMARRDEMVSLLARYGGAPRHGATPEGQFLPSAGRKVHGDYKRDLDAGKLRLSVLPPPPEPPLTEGAEALFAAISARDVDAAAALLRAGENPNATRAREESFSLMTGGRYKSGDMEMYSAKFEWRETLLEAAAVATAGAVSAADADLVRLLLQHGAKADDRALLRAVQANDIRLVGLLLENGAPPDAVVFVPEVVELNDIYAGMSESLEKVERHVLHFASGEVARRLVERGAYASRSDMANAIRAEDWVSAQAAFVREGGFTREKAKDHAWAAVLHVAFDNERSDDEQTGRAAFRHEVAYRYLVWSLNPFTYRPETMAAWDTHFRECAVEYAVRYPVIPPFDRRSGFLPRVPEVIAGADDAEFLDRLLTPPDSHVNFHDFMGSGALRCRRLLIARGLVSPDDFLPGTEM